MDRIAVWLEQVLNISEQAQVRLLISGVILVALWVTYRLILWSIARRISDQRASFYWQKTAKYIFILLAFLLVGRVWFEGFQSLATYLGLFSAGVAIALRELFVNIFGWVFIVSRKPFELGDRVQIGDFAGDVIDQGVFQFSLMEIGRWVDAEQSTGRILHVPNGLVLTNVLANYTTGNHYIWNEVPVLVSFDSDWEKAKCILQEIAEQHVEVLDQQVEEGIRETGKRYLVRYGKLTPTVYTSVKDNGILLTIRYLCGTRNRRDSTQAIWENILQAFDRATDVRLGYPAARVERG